jgi:hypothetical protein
MNTMLAAPRSAGCGSLQPSRATKTDRRPLIHESRSDEDAVPRLALGAEAFSRLLVDADVANDVDHRAAAAAFRAARRRG